MKEFYASTIQEGTWRYIDLFTQFANLKKIVVNSEKANQICFCLKQAKEYYSAAKNSTLLTKPVLLYYGMLNLAKALILLKKENVTLNNNLSTHGLKRMQTRAIKSLFSLSCRVVNSPNSVFFNLLGVASKDRFILSTIIDNKGAKQEYSSDFTGQSQSLGKKFKISEIVCLIPELYEILIEASPYIPKTIPISSIFLKQRLDAEKKNSIITRANLVIRHNKNLKIKKVIKSFEKKPVLKDWKFINDRWDVFEYKIDSECEKLTFPDIRETIFREQFGLFANQKKLAMCELIHHYLLSFILGDAARYSPYLWWKLMDKKINENKILEYFLNITEVKFPLLILRELRDELIYFKQT